ncbi:MAG: ATP-binding protein [Pirellulaceae bacterium]
MPTRDRQRGSAVVCYALLIVAMGIIDTALSRWDPSNHRLAINLIFNVALMVLPLICVLVFGRVGLATILCVVAISFGFLLQFYFSRQMIQLSYLAPVAPIVTIVSGRRAGVITFVSLAIAIFGVVSLPPDATFDTRRLRPPEIEGITILFVSFAAMLAALWAAASEQASEARRKHAEERAEDLDRMRSLGAFAGGVAHDFNNLLTAIRCHAEVLPESMDRQGILRAADHASRLTSQLLTLGRRHAIRLEPTPLNEVIRDNESTIRSLFGDQRSVRLKLLAEHDWVLCDPLHMQQVLLNLVTNARDATSDKGHLSITTRCIAPPEGTSEDAAAEWIELKVKDNGVGMSKENQRLAIEPFFTTKPRGLGTGLGLSTVYGNIQRMGGLLEIASMPNQGTSVIIRLPLLTDQTDASIAARDELHAPSVSSTPMSILVVDDNSHVLRLTQSRLEKMGHHVETVSSAVDALKRLRSGNIDFVIVDSRMPLVRGWDLAKQVKLEYPKMKLVMMTSVNDPSVDERELSSIQAALLVKPFGDRQIRRSLQRALMLSQN